MASSRSPDHRVGLLAVRRKVITVASIVAVSTQEVISGTQCGIAPRIDRLSGPVSPNSLVNTATTVSVGVPGPPG